MSTKSLLRMFIILKCIIFLTFQGVHANLKWTNLKVHFGFNPFSKYFFQQMSRELKGIDANEWNNLSGEDCTNGGKFNGFRYVDKTDSGMALLYDIQGTIAGIQQILVKTELLANNSYAFDKVPMYVSDSVNGKDVYVITAYFVDPGTICRTGRNAPELEIRGTGTLVYAQNGQSPSEYVIIPRQRNQAIAEGWSINKCFPGMGYHNFYRVEELSATNCTEMRPFFGLYDKDGDMLGFGFTATGHVESNHFEHPLTISTKLIIGPMVPQCLLDIVKSPGRTTMHVYFTERPYLINCLL